MEFSPNRRFFPCPTVWVLAGVVALMLSLPLRGEQPFYDRTHPSKVFGEERNYRIFLPPKYESGKKRYPVIYYFHGHSDRYTLERYDDGKGTVPKITRFVLSHNVIVVAADVPPGTRISLVLENETWTFHYTSDVRYGAEPLFQAFQFHRTHLHRHELKVPGRKYKN